MNFLEEIIKQKRLRLNEARKLCSIEALRRRALGVRGKRTHSFRAALQATRLNVIAEIKRASPSKGLIRDGIDPAKIAERYEAGGAAAISVLTEEDNFNGTLDDLRAVKAATNLPLLRKDFIFDEFQLYEAAEAGADALLLIVASLDNGQIRHFRRITEDDLGMDALVEVHTLDELSRALSCGANLIGVNNRNLQTFAVSIQTSIDLAAAITPQLTFVSESGLRTANDLALLRDLGYKGFLIGETLMRSDRPGESLREILTGRQQADHDPLLERIS